MLDYQRIVDDVRSSLYTANPDTLDFLRAAAADYSVACDEVNERLRQCGGLLGQGLRSEAIQLCEMEPNLLDAVAALDFPEREQWDGLLAHYSIASPAPLLLDVAADLNEAYAVEQPMAALLQRHRLLALARSPLRQRIQTVRKLAAVDGNNPVWLEDLEVFEKERQKQIQREVADAARGDLATLTELCRELQSTQWQELPPASLLKWCAEAHEKLSRKEAMAELEQVEVELNEAFSGFDVERGRQLRERWDELMSAWGPQVDEQLIERASPALEWLREQDDLEQLEGENKAAVASLERALDRNAPLSKLEKYYHAAVRHGHELSPYLEKRYQSRISALQLASTRRTRLIMAGIIAATLLVGTLIGGTIFYQLHLHKVDACAAALSKLIKDDKLKEAQKYLDQLRAEVPQVAASVEIQDLSVRLQGLVQEEAERRTAFARAIQMVRDSIPESPDRKALTRARDLAKTNEEKVSVLQLESAIGAIEREAQAERDQVFIEQLEEFASRLKQLDTDKYPDTRSYRFKIAEFRRDLGMLEDRTGGISPAVRSQLKPLRSRLATIEEELQRRLDEEAYEKRITRAIGDLAGYRKALTEYTQQFPTSSRTADFKRTMEESPLWEGLEEWNGLVKAWKQEDAAKLDSRTAAEYIKLANGILEQYGDYPDAEAVRQRLPYFEAVTRRVKDKEPIEDNLKRLFSDSLMTSLWMIEHTDGRRYYVKYVKGDEPKLNKNGPNSYLYVVNFEGKQTGGMIQGKDVKYAGPAPQCSVAGTVMQFLGQIEGDNWESSFYQMLKTISAEQQMDPLLKRDLLQRTLEVGCQGSYCLSKAFDRHLRMLTTESKVNPFADWLDPKDQEVQHDRRQASKELSDLPDIAAAGKAAAEDLAKLRRTVGTEYRWVGWLYRGRNGAWLCGTQSQSKESGELFVICRQGVGGKVTLDCIGRADRGVVKIDGKRGLLLVEGRPVYLPIP